MDTYFNTNHRCVSCGRCVKACQEEGQQFLTGIRDDCPHKSSDYVPCHHCNKPCINACHYQAIEIERW